jgi:hypothetical protein
MKEQLILQLEKNGWKKRTPATEKEIESLQLAFGITLPEEYLAILQYSNGGSLYGFQTPLIVYAISEVLALHHEHDLYESIPESLIFGGDGGGTIYAFDLRSKNHQVLFFREDYTSYDNIVFQANRLSEVVKKIIDNEKIN